MVVRMETQAQMRMIRIPGNDQGASQGGMGARLFIAFRLKNFSQKFRRFTPRVEDQAFGVIILQTPSKAESIWDSLYWEPGII